MGNITPETWIFSTIEGELLSPDNLSRDWRRIGTARKLPRVSFHALRHTNASVLISKGVDILTISRRLGHSKPSVTLDVYGHLIEGTDTAAAQALDWGARNACRTMISRARLQSGCNSRFVANGARTN